MEFLGLGNEVVQVLADRLLGRVAEQLLRGRVPGNHAGVAVGDDDGRGTDLEEGLELLGLLEQLPGSTLLL